MKTRRSGILLHITSLPSSCGIGDLGPAAYRFADFLHQTRQSLWQILPLNLTQLAFGNSPYHGISAFAFNPLLISPERMVEDGLLNEADIRPVPDFPKDHVDYPAVIAYKEKLFERAWSRFKTLGQDHDYEEFCLENSYWLDDLALFIALKSRFPGQVWRQWPPEIRDRRPEALKTLRKELRDKIEMEKFLQYIFFQQWRSLRKYCNEKGILIFGDLPIYVTYDSADLWTRPEIFKLDKEKKPWVVAGVPPDYFSETGQLWGNPLYNWEVLKASGYDWWVRRIGHNLGCFDWVRIDHFRGFVAYWEIPASEKSAVNGKWVEAPVTDFFTTILKKFPDLPIVAEDLGVITPDVREVMERFGFAGMKLLVFAFGGDLVENPYLPHNHVENCVVYTGTHDCNTVRGWFEKELTAEGREGLFRYLKRELSAEEVSWEFVRLAMMSVANTVILPMQDILGLGEEGRMNRPATTHGNWCWRLAPQSLTPDLTAGLLEITELHGRG